MAVLVQRLNAKDTRTYRLNTDYFFFWKTAYASEFRNLANQICVNKKDAGKLVEAYRTITKREHSFIVLDLKASSTQELPLAVRDSALDCLVESLWNIF
jgi:hypothetical protein